MPTSRHVAVLGCALLLSIASCTQQKSEHKDKKKQQQKDQPPGAITQVIAAHGGLDQWEKQRTLAFSFNDERHTIDLHNRRVRIEAPTYSMGNNGRQVWIKQSGDDFTGSPTFYHSLFFYFHTMPFVLADDGINYTPAGTKTIRDTTYNALKLSFDAGVGDAANDEYVLYYHPETKKMGWLAYTSTFQSEQASDDFNMIRYTGWRPVNGLQLPTKLQWHTYENGTVGKAAGPPRIFNEVTLSEAPKDSSFYAMPANARVDSAAIQP